MKLKDMSILEYTRGKLYISKLQTSRKVLRLLISQFSTKSTSVVQQDTFSGSQDSTTFLRMSTSASSISMVPGIKVQPQGHLLVDDDLHIKVEGLSPRQPVTLLARLEEEGKRYESYCCLTADQHGLVDLRRSESVGGTYTGASSMGHFWSMVPSAGQMDGIRLMKKNMDTPFKTDLSVHEGHLSRDQLGQDTERLCSTVIEQHYKAPGVKKVTVTDGRIRGTVFIPPGDGPFPGVIDMFGTVGGNVEHRAMLLASRGIVAYALPYFLYEDLPRDLNDIDLDYFMEAVDWLLKQDFVISDGVGVVGTSKGGEFALLMAAYNPKVKSVVNINGCPFCAIYPVKYSRGDFTAVEIDLSKFEDLDVKYVINKSLDFKQSDIFPVWNNDAKVLNILSEDDMCVPKEGIRMLKPLYPPKKTHNCTVLAYDGAGHLVEPPYTPLCRYSYHKSYNMFFWWGGHPKEHAFAQEDSWRRILRHLHETLVPASVKSKL